MNPIPTSSLSFQSLAYRLRDSVTIDLRDDTVVLILAYPLKTITLHRSWQAVCRRLAGHQWLPQEEVAALMAGSALPKVSAFLNQLVFKGFLERQGQPRLSQFPRVSIIIPVRNRPDDIAACLGSLTQLAYPADRLEIIVVDDASQDSTPAVAAGFPIRLIRLKRHKQASFCRNLGARQAGGEILAFIDSDCLADALWLNQLIPAFEDPTLAAIGGKVDAYYTAKPLDRYEKAKSSLMISSHAKRSERGDPFFYVPACNFLIRRPLFMALKGFDVHMAVGEDVDLCWRLQNQGDHLEYSTDGVVYHKHRNQWLAFCRRRFDYGTSEPLLQKMHPERIKQLWLPPAALLFWAWVGVGLVQGQWGWGACAALTLVIDAMVKKRRLKQLAVGLAPVLSAVIRGYGAFVYHLSAFASRYYLGWALLAAPWVPDLAAVIGGMHLVHGVGEYVLKKSRLGILQFMWFFTLEQLSYQAGVWWGCWRQHRLSSVNPVIVWKGSRP